MKFTFELVSKKRPKGQPHPEGPTSTPRRKGQPSNSREGRAYPHTQEKEGPTLTPRRAPAQESGRPTPPRKANFNPEKEGPTPNPKRKGQPQPTGPTPTQRADPCLLFSSTNINFKNIDFVCDYLLFTTTESWPIHKPKRRKGQPRPEGPKPRPQEGRANPHGQEKEGPTPTPKGQLQPREGRANPKPLS